MASIQPSSPLQLNHQRYRVRCYFFHLSFRTPPVPLVFEDCPVYQPASQPRTSLLKFEGGGFSAPVIWSGQEQLVALLAALRHYPAGKTRKKKKQDRIRASGQIPPEPWPKACTTSYWQTCRNHCVRWNKSAQSAIKIQPALIRSVRFGSGLKLSA